MSTTFITTFSTSRRRNTAAPTISRSLSTASTSLRIDSAQPTRFSSFELDSSFFDSNTATAIASTRTTETTSGPDLATSAADAGVICAADDHCTANTVCVEGKCTAFNDASPLGGLSAEPTSKLNTASAIGVGVGLVVLFALLIGFGYWFWRIRGRQKPMASIESSAQNRTRSASNATDQKTLVASLPNSPRNADFQQHAMPPEFFAKALEYNAGGKEKAEYRRSGSIDTSDCRSIATNKALPAPPPCNNPLPPPPTEPKRYAINVNINKSMIFDDEVLVRAMSPLRDSNCSTPRERAPKYRFEEYLPPVAKTPPISITRRPASSKRSSEYELDRYPKSRKLSGTSWANENGSDDDTSVKSPREKALTKLESKPPQLPPPELLPPSPSFSFHSYDWYQDIISDQPNGERTPTQTSFPRSLSPSPLAPENDAVLVPEPLSPAKSALPSTTAHLHPCSAASPASPNYRLSPTVYQAPARAPHMPRIPPPPASPPSRTARISSLSTMTRQTHNSRSWLPDEGLYLPEEGTIDSYKKFRRPSDSSRPISYSPLT